MNLMQRQKHIQLCVDRVIHKMLLQLLNPTVDHISNNNNNNNYIGPFKGGLYLFTPPPTHFLKLIYKCCCKHLLTISKVLETLEHPLQSYGAFCPCNFTYLDSKLEETRTGEAYGKGKFFGVIKWLPLIPGS